MHSHDRSTGLSPTEEKPGVELGHDEHVPSGQPVTQLLHSVTPKVEDQDPDVEPDLTLKMVVTAVAAALSYVATVFTIAVPAFVLSDIVASTGGAENKAWAIQVIALATAVLAPILGLAADLFGRRWILIVSMIFGVAGALIAGQAKSFDVLIAGRVIGAIGNGAQGISLAIPSEVLPRRYRPIGQALANVSVAVFAIVGLIVSAYCVKHNVGGAGEGWRYAFHMETMIWGLSAVFLFFCYTPPPRSEVLKVAGVEVSSTASFWDRLRRLDILGTLLLACFIVPFMLGLGWLDSPYPVSNPHVAANLGVGLAFLAVFIGYEWKGRSDGILHHDLFRSSRNIWLGLIAIFAEGTAFFSYQLFYPIGVAVLWETDPIKAALRVSSPFWAFMIISPIGAIYTAKTKEIKGAPTLGFLLMLVGIIGFATVSMSQKALSGVWGAIFAAGFALPLTMITVIIQFCAPGALLATSTGMYIAVRAVGGTAGSTIALAVFSSKMSVQLPARVAAAALQNGAAPQDLPTLIPAAANFQADAIAQYMASRLSPNEVPVFVGALLGAVKESYSYSLHFGWWTVLPFVVTAIACSLSFASIREKFSYIIDAPIESVKHNRHSLHNVAS